MTLRTVHTAQIQISSRVACCSTQRKRTACQSGWKRRRSLWLLPKQAGPRTQIPGTPPERSAAGCGQKNHTVRLRTRTCPSAHEDGATPWLHVAVGAGGSHRRAANTGQNNRTGLTHQARRCSEQPENTRYRGRNPLAPAQTFPHRPGLILLLGHEIFGKKHKAFSAERIKLVERSTRWVTGAQDWFRNTKSKRKPRRYSLGHAERVKINASFWTR